jgi:membrane protein implicated in regulation of membrane protease activity
MPIASFVFGIFLVWSGYGIVMWVGKNDRSYWWTLPAVFIVILGLVFTMVFLKWVHESSREQYDNQSFYNAYTEFTHAKGVRESSV